LLDYTTENYTVEYTHKQQNYTVKSTTKDTKNL